MLVRDSSPRAHSPASCARVRKPFGILTKKLVLDRDSLLAYSLKMMLERDSLLAYSPAIRAFELNMWAWDGRPLSWPYPTFIELIRRGRFDRSHHWTYKTDTAWAISIAATITYKINKNSSMNYVVWNAVSDMATNADADISICLTCQSLGQFICHVLTMAIDLRGDEQTIRLNIEEYTGVNNSTLYM